MSPELFHLLILIIFANGAPVVLANVMGYRADYPIDMGRRFFDGKPLFGRAKTWRGLVFSIVVTAFLGFLLGYGLVTGGLVALWAMSGDLCSSFIKRRMDRRSSSMAPLLDQVPESLLPGLLMMERFSLQGKDVVILVSAFIIIELLLSKVLYELGIRRTPY